MISKTDTRARVLGCNLTLFVKEGIMAGQRIGYIRASSLDQNTHRQLEGIELDRIFTEKASGKDARRPGSKPVKSACPHGKDGLREVTGRLGRETESLPVPGRAPGKPAW
jgi:hypothetical protein